MSRLSALKLELESGDYTGYQKIGDYLFYLSLRENYHESPLIAKAKATAYAFSQHEKVVYDNDCVVGSIAGNYARNLNEADLRKAEAVRNSFGRNHFLTNADHFAPDYAYILNRGVGGVLEDIAQSICAHQSDADAVKKTEFLRGAEIAMQGLSDMIRGYGEAAKQKGLNTAADICKKIAWDAPQSFREALQLVWLIHISFQYENRYAMALGRLDQYLFPYYERDVKSGVMTPDEALELLACTLYKINEYKFFQNCYDVVNICIGGVDRDGRTAINELSYLILEAVKACGVCGPNLSARMPADAPDSFWNKCLEVIGTGIGYPALMNDVVNVAALQRYGYAIEDCRDYSMVGCIENFLTGKQPAWSDGRFNTPKYLELALNDGKCMRTGAQLGPHTGKAEEIGSMEQFLHAFEKQLEFGAKEYVALFNHENGRYQAEMYAQPYLSCYCPTCIERGLDICDGGAYYPSVHGVGCMGIATVADSLAAVEKVVFEDRTLTLAALRDILAVNFEGSADLRKKLLDAPKYGNNVNFVDKYAIWYVDFHYRLFEDYRTRDGGRFYIGIASNVSNIPAGAEIAATPDGRGCEEPLSDAASPMHGLDKNGLTSVVNSISKPDYSKAALGTVLNVKLTPDMVNRVEKRDKLRELIKIYFAQGGQEMQINCVSRKTLMDARRNPERYRDLVVRVSGFSAFYITLDDAVQKDILERTEHE